MKKNMKKYYNIYKSIAAVCICIMISGCSESETGEENKLGGDDLVTAIQSIYKNYEYFSDGTEQSEDNQVISQYIQNDNNQMNGTQYIEVEDDEEEDSWQSQPPEKYCGGDFTEFSYLGGDYRLYKKQEGNYAQLMILNSAKGDVIIPEKIPYEDEEYTLVGIAAITQEGGNNNCKSEDAVRSIEIPDTVIWLNDGLFSSFNDLQRVHLPQELKHIPPQIFSNCWRLSSVNIPENIITIGAGAFRSVAEKINNLVLEIPDTVQAIGDYAFTDANVSRIHIPKNIKIIGDEAFAGAQIEEIVLPYVTNTSGALPAKLLKGSQIRMAEMEKGWEEIPDEMFAECKKLRVVKLPETIKKIGISAFNEDSALLYVNIPENTEEIEYGAFTKCVSLQEIILPEKLRVISEYVFAWCENAVIRINGVIENVEDGAFVYCKEVHLRQNEVLSYCQNKFPDITFVLEEKIYGGELSMPEGVENIHRDGFSLNDLNIESDNKRRFWSFSQEDSASLLDNQGNRYWQGYSLGASSRETGAFVTYEIGGRVKSFTGVGAVDIEAKEERGGVGFRVYGDDILLYSSKYFSSEEAPEPFNIDISGVQILKIEYVDDRDEKGARYGMNFIPETKLCTIFDGYLFE